MTADDRFSAGNTSWLVQDQPKTQLENPEIQLERSSNYDGFSVATFENTAT
jgi:hypothetical protein